MERLSMRRVNNASSWNSLAKLTRYHPWMRGTGLNEKNWRRMRGTTCTATSSTIGALSRENPEIACASISRLEHAALLNSIPRKTSPSRGDELESHSQIWALKVSKTLALSDIILKLFHVSILRSPEWALSSLPTDLANTQEIVFNIWLLCSCFKLVLRLLCLKTQVISSFSRISGSVVRRVGSGCESLGNALALPWKAGCLSSR